MWAGNGQLGDQCSLLLSRSMETSQPLYLARSQVHGRGVFASQELLRDNCYSLEVVDNKKVTDVYHYLDCLTLLPERTLYRCQAIVTLVDQEIQKETLTLQRGLAVVPRAYASYLNHTEKKKANAKIEIRIDGVVMDFQWWAQRECPAILTSLAWEWPGRYSQPLNIRLSGFSGLSALRDLFKNSKPKIELVIIPLRDIRADEELLIFYGEHDVTQDACFDAIDVEDDGHMQLLREKCVCHRATVVGRDKLLEQHMLKLDNLKPRRNPAKGMKTSPKGKQSPRKKQE